MAVQKTFMDFVEQTTEKLETQKPQLLREPQQLNRESQEFKPKHDTALAQKVANELSEMWSSIYHKANFDKFLDIIIASLERREADYMALIKGVDRNVLETYAKMYGTLYHYFIDGNYGDPLGTFYMTQFSYGRNGEFYTPWNIAYFMAQMLDPKPEEIVCDPCVGSGIMLLAARCIIHEKYGWITSSRYGRNLYGIDNSDRAVKTAKINLYLTDYIYMICLMQEVVFTQNERVEEKKVMM